MKSKDEKGEVVVEASIVVTLVVIFITLMLYIGMILYQKTLITVMANQTASNIAQLYGNNLKDPFTGYIDPDRVYQSITYSSLKTDAYMDVINQKTSVMGQYRLKSSRILNNGATTVDVDIVKKPNELLKSQIIVTVHDKYDVPLVNMFGVNSGLVEFSATGRADCVDVLEYLDGVDAMGEGVVPSLPDSDTCRVTFFRDKYSGQFHAAEPVLRGKSMITSSHYSHCKMPDPPRYGDLEFTGWVMENGSAFTASQQIDEDIAVYGTWLCQITFEPEGGKVNPTTKKVELRGTTDFPIPTRSGYAFEGWYTEKEGKGEQYYSNVTEITGNITLFAKWRCTHDFNVTLISKGDCKHNSRWKYTCIRCPYSYEKDGNKGNCIKGNQTTVNPGCEEDGWMGYKCKLCSRVIEGEKIKALGHDWNGRCGIEHDLGVDAYRMGNHGGENYKETTWGECYLCVRCKAPHGKSGQKKRGEWVTRNGQKVSEGMICIKHKDKSGKEHNDRSYQKTNTNLNLSLELHGAY